MKRYFLAPRSGEKSYKNYVSTIKHGVPFERIEKYLTEEGKNILNKQEVIYAWANREGKRTSWERINAGDTVIFYANGNFIMAGDVVYKQYSPDLAIAMWPADEHGNPWSYTFFINNLRYFKIPLKHFNLVSGYKFKALMGFQEISKAHLNNILIHHKTMEELFDEFSDGDSVEIPKSNERVYINVSDQVVPMISDKGIVKYQRSYEVSEQVNKKKKSGAVDFDELNRHKAKIGSIGEEIVLNFEKHFLQGKGRSDLAEKVKRISLDDASAGYDIISFDEIGNEKKVEVKATFRDQSDNFSFHISNNEKMVAERSNNYFIYLVYAANTQKPKIHVIKNPFKQKDELTLEPVNYIARGKFIDN